jgi:hypothetical protein
MHPFFSETMVRHRGRELDRAVHDVYHLQPLPAVSRRPHPVRESVLLRLTTVGDTEAIERLAALEAVPAPDSRCVVAEVGGALVAALPLRGGKVIADPFRATAHLIPLLELRAKQLEGQAHHRRAGLRGLVRALGRA